MIERFEKHGSARHGSSAGAFAVALAVILAAGCATAPKREIVFPPPPDTGRILFVRSFSSQHDVDTSFWTKVLNVLIPRAHATLLRNPYGIALSPDEKTLYVAASASGRVVAVNRETGRFVDFGAEGDNRLVRPIGLGVDAQGFIYVADRNSSAIYVFSPDLKLVRKVGVGLLKLPTSLAVDRKNQLLYVVNDAANQDGTHKVETFSLKGEHLRTLGGGRGADHGKFNFPSEVAVSPSGELYVSDMLNFRIEVFDAEGRYLRTIGEQGHGVPGKFDKVHGVAWDSFGDLYVVDAAQGVQILNERLQPLLGFNNGLLQLPLQIAIDSKNHIFVTDFIDRVNEFVLINTTKADTLGRPATSPAEAPTVPSPEQTK